jgi:hypothetical protein
MNTKASILAIEGKTSITGASIPEVRALSIGKLLQDKFKLFEIEKEPSENVLYVGFLEKHFKLYKAMFNKYVALSANKTSLKKMTFDDMKQKKSKMNLADIYAFMNDFKLTKHPALKRDTVTKIIRLINLKSRGDEKVKKLQAIT